MTTTLTETNVDANKGKVVPTQNSGARRIGDVLIARGLVTEETLRTALATAQRAKARLGEVLVSTGAVDSSALAQALADQWDMEFVHLIDEPTEPGLLDKVDVDKLLRERWLPLTRNIEGKLRVAVTDHGSDELKNEISEMLGCEVVLCIADQWDMQRALLERLGEEVIDRAALGLWGRSPEQSARKVLVPWQKWTLLGMVGAAVMAAVIWPKSVAAAAILSISIAFAISTVFKFWASMNGARVAVKRGVAAPIPESELPKYTVLVPVYKEANIVGQLIKNLGSLDYPTHLLEVLILVEEDDLETQAAALATTPPPHFQIVIVPSGGPKTKPKACNVGLEFATGDLLVIYDAEDRPEPDQLKKAARAFRDAGPDLVCVQAALNYFNATENILTRMFTLEYSFWFDYMLPGLEKAKLPIPLGGTSNHFRVDGLRKLGGWDPFNVTEDADLGIRASAVGMRVGVIDSTTLEEANNSTPNWIRQRSRWIKGYMQTTLVHLRNPLQLIKIAGLRQTLSFLFLVAGTPLTFLAVPVMYALFGVSLFMSPALLSQLFPGWVLWLSLVNFGLGASLMVHLSMMGSLKRHRFDLAGWGLINPLYWMLHSVAAYKALWQLITKPHYWEKTNHGLTAMTHEEGEEAHA